MSVTARALPAVALLLPAMLLACDAPDAKDSVEGEPTASSDDAPATGDDPQDPPAPQQPPELSVDFQPRTPALDPDAFPSSGLRWADVGTVASDAWYVAMDDGRIAAGGPSGVFTYDGDTWTTLHNDVGQVNGLAYHGDTLVVASMHGVWTQTGADAPLEAVPALEGWAQLDHGEAGVYVSVDGEAYRVVPELEPLGDAQGIIGAECFSQVEDGKLIIFSLDEDRWLELPLPDTSSIFEFAVRGSRNWVFGSRSVFQTDDGGDSWDMVSEVDDLDFFDVRRDGDRLLTMMWDRIGWSDDDGLTWSSMALSGFYNAIAVDDGRAIVTQINGTSGSFDLFLHELVDGSDAAPELLPELPPQPIFHPVMLEDGRLVVATSNALKIIDSDTRQTLAYNYWAPINDVAVSQDTFREGVWRATYGYPRFASSIGSTWTGTNRDWPTIAGDSWAGYRTATALAPTEEGIYACTGKDIEALEIGSVETGAGVWWLDSLGHWWSEVGTDFPRSPETDSRAASCSGLWHIDGRLFAAAGEVTVELDAEQVWRPVPGLDAIQGLGRTTDGWWALTADGLAFSADGSSFGTPDAATAGATELAVYLDDPVVLLDGEAIIGRPDAWERILGNRATGLSTLQAVDGSLMAVTRTHTLVRLQD